MFWKNLGSKIFVLIIVFLFPLLYLLCGKNNLHSESRLCSFQFALKRYLCFLVLANEIAELLWTIISNPCALQVTCRLLFISFLLEGVGGIPYMSNGEPRAKGRTAGCLSIGCSHTPSGRQLCTAESFCNCFVEFFSTEPFLSIWVSFQASFWHMGGTGFFYQSQPRSDKKSEMNCNLIQVGLCSQVKLLLALLPTETWGQPLRDWWRRMKHLKLPIQSLSLASLLKDVSHGSRVAFKEQNKTEKALFY